MTQDHVAQQRCAAQIEVTVFHAQVVAAVRDLFDGERRNVRAVEDRQCVGRDLDLSGGHLRVFRLAFDDAARHLKDEFASQLGGRAAGLFGRVLLDDDLRQAVAVAQIDEGHGPQIAHLLHPAGERYRLTDVCGTQRAACVGSVHKFLYIFVVCRIFASHKNTN